MSSRYDCKQKLSSSTSKYNERLCPFDTPLVMERSIIPFHGIFGCAVFMNLVYIYTIQHYGPNSCTKWNYHITAVTL